MNDSLLKALNAIKDLIANGETAEAIDALLQVDKTFGLNMENDILQVSAGFRNNERGRKILGIVTEENYKIGLAQANNSVLGLIDEAPKRLPKSTTPSQSVDNQVVTGTPKLVVLYHIDDASHALALEKQMKLLTRAGKISVFFQQKEGLASPEGVFEHTKKAIKNAHLIVVLATEDFFFEDENFQLVEFAKTSGRSIVPILVKSFNMAGSGIEGLRALPSNNKFINTGWPSPDAAWLDVANGLKTVLLPNG